MPQQQEPELLIKLGGSGWRAELRVEPPADSEGRDVSFWIAWSRYDDSAPRLVRTKVLYTTAMNLGQGEDGWGEWQVKIYRCREQGDAEALRAHLHRQAADIQRANADLAGARIAINPPWTVVPVQIVRGDFHEDTFDGTVRTELAASPRTLVDRAVRRLPSWFAASPDVAAMTVLAISPSIHRIEWPVLQPAPGTEHLRDFRGMAAGLDVLHSAGTAHCDIKPDNVCRYSVPGSSGYVLIDADAATRFEPPPRSIRSTRPYICKEALRAARLAAVNHSWTIDRAVMKAQDRFGFALVVLTALAGRDWVERTLLWTDEEDDVENRRIDDQAQIASALSRLWPDTPDRRWRPLIQVLVEPFGDGIDAESWSAAMWVQRLLEAQGRCAIQREQVEAVRLPQADPEQVARFRDELEEIRRETQATPAPGPQLLRQAYAVVGRQAEAVALRAAVRWAGGWAGGITTVMILIVFSKVMWDK